MLTGSAVAKVEGNTVTLTSGKEIPFGVCVWSTGNKALDFVQNLGLPLSKDGRILVNENLKVEGPEDVFALGDCAVQPEKPLPMIAQAAKQQAIYLGKVLNKDHKKPFR